VTATVELPRHLREQRGFLSFSEGDEEALAGLIKVLYGSAKAEGTLYMVKHQNAVAFMSFARCAADPTLSPLLFHKVGC